MSGDEVVIVGLCGGLRSGKTTIANLFLKNHAGKARRISFADPVRQQVAMGMGINKSTLGGMDKQKLRPILQAWGNGMREVWGDDYWIDLMFDDPFWNLIPHGSIVFIDDVRYLNEATMIIEEGGVLIRLDCDEETRIERGAKNDPTSLNHPSEVGLDGFSSYLATIDTSSLLPHEAYAQIHQVLTNVGIID